MEIQVLYRGIDKHQSALNVKGEGQQIDIVCTNNVVLNAYFLLLIQFCYILEKSEGANDLQGCSHCS